MIEYAVYPFDVMNITQNYNKGNHLPHWKKSKNYSDKPWDEACADSGRSYFVPQNDFVIEEVLGLNTSTTNSVRLKSINKLTTPFKKDADYLYLTLTHINEDNLKQVRKGQLLKKGSKILLEGTDGQSTGNHFHITANFGKYYGMLKNSNGSWCFTYDKSLKPEEAFYVDTKFTKLKNSGGSIFKELPKTEQKNESTRSEIELLKKQILELQTQIIEKEKIISTKDEYIKQLEDKVVEFSSKNNFKKIFTCNKNGTYKIKLNKKENLYIK